MIQDIIALVGQAIGGAKATSSDTSNGTQQVHRKSFYPSTVLTIHYASFPISLGIQRHARWYRLPTYRDHCLLLRHRVSCLNTHKSIRHRIPMDTERDHDVPLKKISKDVITISCTTGMDTLFLLIRSIYRTSELADGWNGRILRR